MKKITIFITQSAGEIDIVLPIISALKKKNLEFEIYFTSEKIYNSFAKSKFYLFCADKLNIKVRRFKLFNKIDHNHLKKKLQYYPIKILSIIKSLFLIPVLKKSHIYMHEITNQRDSTNILYYCSLFFKKEIYVYHHGQSINPAPLKDLRWTTYKDAEKKNFFCCFINLPPIGLNPQDISNNIISVYQLHIVSGMN